MSILIKGMEMPTSKPICIVIDVAGQARQYDLNNEKFIDDELYEAVPVPPHGRLIDADALKAMWDNEVARLLEKGIEYLDYHAEWLSCNCTGDGYGNSAEDWLDWLKEEVTANDS